MVGTVFTMLGAGMVGYAGYGINEAIKKVRNEHVLLLEEEYRKKIEEPVLNDWQITLGYENFGGYKRPIIADMRYIPHMLICGLARQGKSAMIEYAVRNKNVILMNTDADKDFLSIKGERVNDVKEIETVLDTLVKVVKNDLVTYVVIDEILALIKSGNGKKIMNSITQLLANGSHKNIYIIALSQCAEKDIVDNKHLYNVRVCFKMLDDSSYKVVLGKAPEEIYIRRREFYYVAENIGKGYTYDL